jgi:crotonobetainyl-CoA:carnitine CoA-transferase CaiB-like acyl-CoA transferase
MQFFEGLRIVELGTWLAAPAATALLADLGAEVIKVEPPAGDPGRRFLAAIGASSDEAPVFALENRHKAGVTLDLSEAANRSALEQLLGSADVFVTNMRVGALERLGLDPDELTRRYPRLIYASMTGYGLRGGDRDRPSYDVGAFWARSGLSHQLTLPGQPPVSPTGGYGDHVTALSLCCAVLAGLLEREATGKGGLVETSLLRVGGWVLGGDLAIQAALGRAHGVAPRTESRTPLVNSYRTADDRWFFLMCPEVARHLPKVCEVIGQPELATDERFATVPALRTHRRHLIAVLDEAFASRPLAEWEKRFEAAGVWWEPVSTPAEVLQSEQLAANDAILPVVSSDRVHRMITAPFGVFGHCPPQPARAPALGGDNDRLLVRDHDR